MKYVLFERFDLAMPDAAVKACSHQGACDEDVAFWANRIKRHENITPERLAAELKEYGSWDDEELKDDEANWRRIIWIAAGNIKDNVNEQLD